MTGNQKQNAVNWIGFCALGTLSSTALHFMPLAGEHLAPAPVFCQVSLFGIGKTSQQPNEPQIFEGLRVAEPNGIELQSLFPNAYAEQGEFCGFELKLWTEREDLDLRSSECLVEIRNSHGMLRYRPKLRQVAGEARELSALIYDAFMQNQKISLVMPNASQQAALINVEEYLSSVGNQDNSDTAQHTSLREVLGQEVEEIELSATQIATTGSGAILHSSSYISSNLPGAEDSNLAANYHLKLKHLDEVVPIYALYRDAYTGAARMVVEL